MFEAECSVRSKLKAMSNINGLLCLTFGMLACYFWLPTADAAVLFAFAYLIWLQTVAVALWHVLLDF